MQNSKIAAAPSSPGVQGMRCLFSRISSYHRLSLCQVAQRDFCCGAAAVAAAQETLLNAAAPTHHHHHHHHQQQQTVSPPASPHAHHQQQQPSTNIKSNSNWPGLSLWRAKGVDLGRGWGSKNKADPSIPAAGAAAAEQVPLPSSLVGVALLVLNTADPNLKAALAHRGWKAYSAGEICLHPEDAPDAAAAAVVDRNNSRSSSQQQECASAAPCDHPHQQCHHHHQQQYSPNNNPPDRPARPATPQLVVPKLVPSPKDSQLPLSAHLLHNLAHIELNAIDLAMDTVARYSHLRLPAGFYEDFARVADDESRHFGWCVQRMAELGHRYGDMVAHDLLWEGAQASAGNLAARLAIVPMSQEARGLDAGQRLAARLVGAGDARSASIVSQIALEERAHVAVGVEWFGRVCVALGVAPPAAFRAWVARLGPELLKGPFNHQERQLVGLHRAFYDVNEWPQELQQQVVKPAVAAAARGKGMAVASSGEPMGTPEQQQQQRQPPVLKDAPQPQVAAIGDAATLQHSSSGSGSLQEALCASAVPNTGPALQQLRERLWRMLEEEAGVCNI